MTKLETDQSDVSQLTGYNDFRFEYQHSISFGLREKQLSDLEDLMSPKYFIQFVGSDHNVLVCEQEFVQFSNQSDCQLDKPDEQ